MSGAEPPAPGEVHLWLASPGSMEPGIAGRLLELLGPQERERHARFHFERHRREYLAAHALLRLSLSRHAPVGPRAWTFSAGPRGRPELAGPPGVPPLRFNLSHTEGLVACAVTCGADVGVDVEHVVERRWDVLALARQVFAADELRDLQARPHGERAARFFDYWTLKEAYAKARGDGLSLPLQSVAYRLQGEGRVGVSFHPPLDDDPADWWFTLLHPTPTHRAALAVRSGAGAGTRLRVRFLRWSAAPREVDPARHGWTALHSPGG